MKSQEWENKLLHGSSGEDAWDILKDLKWAEQNRDRFQDHLDKISYVLDIDWWDGDFPIKEFLEKIKSIIINSI